MAYITLAQLKGYLRNEAKADDSVLDSVAAAASRAIDDFCQRNFDAYGGGGATALPFVPNGDVVIDIPDATTVTAISEDGTSLASTYWQAEPVGGLDGAGRTVPYNRVRRIDGGVWAQKSGYPGKASLSITATWGWSATPDAVVTACLIVAQRLVDERHNRGGLVDFGEFAAVARRHVSGLTDLLGPLRSPRSWGMA